MNTTGQQVFQYSNPCRLPDASGNNGFAVPNYFPQMPNTKPHPHFKKNNGLDPYTFLSYWRVRFPKDGFDQRGHINCNKNNSYAAYFYPNCYKTSSSGINLGWVSPYMGISRNNLSSYKCKSQQPPLCPGGSFRACIDTCPDNPPSKFNDCAALCRQLCP